MLLYDFGLSISPVKIRWVLAELDLGYERIEVDLFKRQQRDPAFLQVNPFGRIPVLEDRGVAMRESNAILCYLGRNYPKRDLWPSNSRLEQEALQWLFYEAVHMAANFGSVWANTFVMPKVGRPPRSEEEMAEHYKWIRISLQQLDHHFAAHKFILGNEFSLVDCAIGANIAALKETPLAADDFPHVWSYRDTIAARDTWERSAGSAIWDH